MKYIFLVAGKGSRLRPLTLKQAKSLYKLDKETTVLQRMISLIKKIDTKSDIVVVDGFMYKNIECELEGVTFIRNPFYEVTNSIASLWFARQHLLSDNVTIINGDVVMENKLLKQILCQPTNKATILVDSSIKSGGDYNVQVEGEKVLVMSKDLSNYYGEYAGVTKLDSDSSVRLKKMVEQMIDYGMYDQWYENALDLLIFNENFDLFYKDIADYRWTEVDCVDDLLLARQIHISEEK